MSKIIMTHVDQITDPKFNELLTWIKQTLELSLEKAVGHMSDPISYPLAKKPMSFERIILKRLNSLPNEQQENAKIYYHQRISEPEEVRIQRYGILAQTDLSLPVEIQTQTFSLVRDSLPALNFEDFQGIALRVGTPIAQSSATYPDPIPNRTLDIRIRKVYCRDETDSWLEPEWSGADDIHLGGIVVDSTATAREIHEFKVGEFDDDDIEDYGKNGRIFVTFEFLVLNVWPQTFTVTFTLAEVDMGDLGDFIQNMLDEIKDTISDYISEEIAEEVMGTAIGTAIGTIFPGLGNAIGALVGAAVGWLIGEIGQWVADEVFDPVTVSLEIPSAYHCWTGTGLISPEARVDFRGHNGHYELTYDWRFHRELEGYVTLLRGRPPGNFSNSYSGSGFLPSWYQVVPGRFSRNRNTDLLLYDPVSGKTEVQHVLGSEGLKFLHASNDQRKTWTHIVPGQFCDSEFTDLMYYDASAGEIAFYKCLGNGTFRLLRKHSGVRRTWFLIVPGDFTGDDLSEILFYDPVVGDAEIYTTDGQGGMSLLRRYTGWRHTWSSIAYTERGGLRQLLLHDQEHGETLMYWFLGRDRLIKIKEHSDMHKNASQLIPGKFGISDTSAAEWIFFDMHEGEMTVYESDLWGEFNKLKTITDIAWKGTPTMLVPIDFASARYTDLFLYRVGKPIPTLQIEAPSSVKIRPGQIDATITIDAIYRHLEQPITFVWHVEPQQVGIISHENQGQRLKIRRVLPGYYTINLRAIDNQGEILTATANFTVNKSNGPPIP